MLGVLEKPVFVGERIDAASKTVISAPVDVWGMNAARLLLNVREIGAPGGSDSVKIEPVFLDSKDVAYLDANTTYGAVTLVGTDTPVAKTYVIPNPGISLALKLTGSGGLSSSTGFIVDATLILEPIIIG